MTDTSERTRPTELYLDLLKGVLTRALFDDLPRRVSPHWWPPLRRAFLLFDRHVLAPRKLLLVRQDATGARRADGRDHPAEGETMIGLARLDNLQHCIDTLLADDVPGDLLEAGVWKGGASIFMEAVLAAHDANDRQVWVCDSFAGLPRPDPDRYPADRGDDLWADRFLAVPLADVQRNFARYGMLRDNVRFVKGLFQDTLPTLPVERIALLRADGDMYESTVAVLDNLYDKVSVGGFVVIDDYGAIPACRTAVDDFRARRGVREPLVPIDWSGRYWRKGAVAAADPDPRP